MNNYWDYDTQKIKAARPKATPRKPVTRVLWISLGVMLGFFVIILSVTAMSNRQPQKTPQQQQQQGSTSNKGSTATRSVTTTPSKTATTKPTATSPATNSPSGQAMPVGDIPGWHQVFTDNFTKNVPLGGFPGPYASKWNVYPDGWPNLDGTYYPSNVISVQNGILNYHLHTANGIHMIAATLPIIPGAVGSEGGLLYGRYDIRFRSDAISGYKTAFLLWPDSETWPRDGEIDFPEGSLNSTMAGYMHYQGATQPHDQAKGNTNTTYTSWHTATIEWTSTALYFILDGVTVMTATHNIPNTPMHWVLQTETSGLALSGAEAGNVQIDWVAIYVPSSTTSAHTTSSASIESLSLSSLHHMQSAYIQDEEEKIRKI